jgi:type IV pilus assembly protein PilN
MIKINLLPREARRRTVRVKVPQAAIVAVAILVAGGMWGYWYLVRRNVGKLRADIAATQNEIGRNQQTIRLVEQYTADKKQLEDRLALIQRLAATQRSPVRLLDGINQALPEGVWLVGVSKVAGRVIIQGYASSHADVAELMLALQRLTPIVSNVELNFSELQVYEGRPVERFEILTILSG